MDYQVQGGVFDEAFDAAGRVRPLYAELIGTLSRLDVAELAESVAEARAERGVSFVVDGVEEAFDLDPVPRLIAASEWSLIARGLAQRVRALDLFVADVYSEQRIVAAGVLPGRALESCGHFEPRLVGLRAAPVRTGVAGPDVVRGASGRFGVLEDNVRTPSGVAYALAARQCLDAHLPRMLADGRRPIDDAASLLAATLRAAAPEGAGEPVTVLLSDGPDNSAWFEHRHLARMLDIPIVSLDDLSVVAGRLEARVDGSRRRIDVVYRRTDEDRLTDADGALTDVGAMLIEPIENGTLTCVNAFGTGVADDKLVHTYVEDMVRFYLGEEPMLPSVRTYDPHMPEHRDVVLDRIDELVVKPRTGYGGHGVVVSPHACEEDVRAVAKAVDAEPEAFVAQETVMISTHPTVIGDRLEPRHVDLRPFVYLVGDEARVLPGGLTRVALDRGALVVNSSQRGGGKDTWVMA
jgi:uncharacterized circularly permuted ATP-grasp superfamily protein